MRTLIVSAGLVGSCLLGPAAAAGGGDAPVNPIVASASAYGGLPVEPFASYDPQRTCTKHPKPGTVELGQWLVATYGGGGGAVNRPCSSGGTSEHKDGRAIDWTLDVTVPADRELAERFLADAFAPDDQGIPAALARRMGIMYVIWNDQMYPAWNQFAPKPYLDSSCRSKRACSATLRHRNHLHISLSRAGGRGLTSWYVAPPTPPA